MTTAVQRRRGTNTEHASFTGLEGEISVNTTNESVHVHDGSTAGGFELMRADGANSTVTLGDISGVTAGTGLSGGGTTGTVTLDIDGTVATLAGTQTFTNKTLTSPILNTPTIGTSFTIGGATITEAELEILDGATVTTTELNYVDGVTSAIQTQIDAKAPLASPSFTGNVSVGGTVDGRDVAADGTKLDGIEAGADVTDTANVTAAGALMDSELTSEASVKALNQGVATTDSPAFAGLTVDTTTLAVDSTNNRVGIGTTSPSSTLEIAKTDQTSGATLSLTNLANGGGWDAGDIIGSINFRTADSSTTQPIRGQIKLFDDSASGSTYAFANAMSFSTGYLNTLNERMRIDSSGKVGIGTASPSQALTVNGTDARIYLTGVDTDINMDASANGQLHLDGSGYGFGIALNGDGAQLYTNSASRDLIFGVNETESARITPTNYMVGTTTPATTLGISTSSSDTGVSMSTTGRLSVANNNSYPLALNRYTSEGSLIQLNESGVTRGAIGIKTNEIFIADTVGGLRMSGLGTNNVIPCTSAGVGTNGVTDLGGNSNRFDDVYASGTIYDSDRNLKQEIEELSEAELRVATACKGLIRKYRWIKRVEEKGDDARIHVGIIAQELRDAFTAEGLDAGRYGMFISNTWWETNEEVAAVEAADAVYETETDEEGNETQVLISEAVEAQEAYIDRIIYDTAEEAPEGATEVTQLGVRYTQLLAFIIAAL